MKPKPVIVTTICSECDLPWEDHGDNPTTADCIRLLKAELSRPRSTTWVYPYPAPYPVYPTYPSWQWSITNSIPMNACSDTVSYETPAINTTATSEVAA